MDIVLAKIVTGEFVVGRLEKRENNIYLIDVYAIMLHPDPKSQQLRSVIIPLMAPFDSEAVKELSVDKFVLATMPVPEEIEKVYIKLTTGLDIVSSGTKIIQ